MAVLAHEDAIGVVKTRMGSMERFEELIERVIVMMNGELSDDAYTLQRVAEEIRAGAGSHLTALFPEGSSGLPSKARDEICENPSQFALSAEMLEIWSAELAQRANLPVGNGLTIR